MIVRAMIKLVKVKMEVIAMAIRMAILTGIVRPAFSFLTKKKERVQYRFRVGK